MKVCMVVLHRELAHPSRKNSLQLCPHPLNHAQRRAVRRHKFHLKIISVTEGLDSVAVVATRVV